MQVAIIETIEWEVLKKEITELKGLVKKLITNQKTVSTRDQTYNLKEAAKILGTQYGWVFKNKHKIGCSRVGRAWIIKQSSIDAYINTTYHKDN
ncbi:helix-turn-helix domain-containing protein [Pedobacter punctiformis]|uniref:Helix-turn-helix domain-containing protein n=1 Tax=Pedobacter punctiformis TaxID=3004097 RepID=A0ABT4LAI9_9SPHI|nr:helix-turn-helix domain-containing protein [Pedobacter sp. HCMS5-2]MCZ4244925.1 helix-turn-helix domain-containing protein [Pedobacter sp. HCMS5-2]